MDNQLEYFHNLYKKLKFKSICVDIETTRFNGPISIIGLYKPTSGEVNVTQLIRGKNLTVKNLKNAIIGCKLFITYNGFKFDIPKIREEFPAVLPKIPILDLYLFAKKINYQTDLKTLENTFNIERMDSKLSRKGISVKLWNKHKRYNDEYALKTLLDFNKEDTINLYPLAEKIMKVYYRKKEQQT